MRAKKVHNTYVGFSFLHKFSMYIVSIYRKKDVTMENFVRFAVTVCVVAVAEVFVFWFLCSSRDILLPREGFSIYKLTYIDNVVYIAKG